MCLFTRPRMDEHLDNLQKIQKNIPKQHSVHFRSRAIFKLPSQKFPVFEMPIELSSSIRSRDGRICFKASALMQTFGFSCDKQIPCGKPQCGGDEDRVTDLLELFMSFDSMRFTFRTLIWPMEFLLSFVQRMARPELRRIKPG